MILSLAWLTVSLPYIYTARQEISKKMQTGMSRENTKGNPLANTNEEKPPSNTSLSEEYLHGTHAYNNFSLETSRLYIHFHESTYIAFHGELLTPPPDIFC